MSKHNLFIEDFMDHDDGGQWRSYDLEASGDTLEELLDSAVYWQTDQDGGSLGDIEADDGKAQDYITAWYEAQLNCQPTDSKL